MTCIFPNIHLHIAILKALEEVVENMAAVDQIEDDVEAARVFLKIAQLAETAEGHFSYIRDCACAGMELRLPEAFERLIARRTAREAAAAVAIIA